MHGIVGIAAMRISINVVMPVVYLFFMLSVTPVTV